MSTLYTILYTHYIHIVCNLVYSLMYTACFHLVYNLLLYIPVSTFYAVLHNMLYYTYFVYYCICLARLPLQFQTTLDFLFNTLSKSYRGWSSGENNMQIGNPFVSSQNDTSHNYISVHVHEVNGYSEYM